MPNMPNPENNNASSSEHDKMVQAMFKDGIGENGLPLKIVEDIPENETDLGKYAESSTFGEHHYKDWTNPSDDADPVPSDESNVTQLPLPPKQP